MKRPPSTLGIRHVALKVADLARAERFYADNLALHRDPSAGAESRLDHFGILLRRQRDVDAWARHLKSRGLKLEREPRTHRDGARSFYVKDPEGVTIQFLHHPPIARPADGAKDE